ncbi:MAG TPA: molybdenum cofactor synthesis protein [Candidatus Margulisbacteria bacterium]|nr:MAG: hypothetical protein A2X43_09210 [Candidatus Margulisbacteria bacterium GWD2_39_127]OGI03600.1 MAG: hypothetical protein A2X42_01050 [Candidatus Margulisbacteria bacterium GWF2_38_17]HAR62296.1 molybdenum cofactor synthesis protein [Candidatus Margulisiibacteriota bacterium]
MFEFVIRSINTSNEKGTAKNPVDKAIIKKGLGIVADAHRGMKNREISLLSREEIDGFKPDLPDGSFGENFTIEGLDTSNIKLLDRMKLRDVVLEVSKIGKECHDRCHIYYSMGDCIMPKKGFFVRVIRGGGIVRPGAKAQYIPKTFKVAVITLSDRASQGVYQDKSGELITSQLQQYFASSDRQVLIDKIVIPDSSLKLISLFLKFIFKSYDIVMTTGGTGVSPKDITIGITRLFVKKEIPGIAEFIRNKYGQHNRNALTSRSLVGVNGKTLIFCLPGSVKAVNEYLAEIIPMLNHLFSMVHDLDMH